MINKRWVLKEQGEPAVVDLLTETLNIDRTLANLLIQRGVKSFDEAKAYFRPRLENLHDPFLMRDMHLAVERIDRAIHKKEKILIYGDYDVDGTTAVALVYTFLKEFYPNVDFYVPDRYAEGYGISYKGIDYAHQQGITLVIALDCGIKAVEKIDYARSLGIDFIICDHHRPGEKLPKAFAILDPKYEECTYPYKELSGCGLGFKLVQAYAKKNRMPFENLKKYLDLVVVSIASDIVPITGENRILAYYGLKLINDKPRPGIEAILSVSRPQRQEEVGSVHAVKRELSINDLVFIIGPRINAAGRIESARNSVELLITEDSERAFKLGTAINNLNTERKSLDSQATSQAIDMIRSDKSLQERKSTVLYNPDWHKGVIGIVASRLIEAFYKPTIILTFADGLITGSARSIKGFDIYDAVDACGDLLEHFGGHTYAAGLSMKPENYPKFREKFEEYVINKMDESLRTPEIEVDSMLDLKDINGKFFRVMKQFAPFGPGNMSPVFQTNNLIDTGYARIVGNNHLKMSVVQLEVSSYPISAIAFQQGDEEHLEYVKSGRPFNICYHIEENEWNGQKSLQLNIKDIKHALT